MLRSTYIVFFGVLLGWTSSPSTLAVDRSWDSGGANENWSTTSNWSPNGDPGGDDLTIGNILQGFNAASIVDQDFSIDSLSLDNGASVDTDNNRLIVNGLTSLATNSESTLLLRERTSGSAAFPQSLSTDSLFVGSNSTIEMYDDAVLEVDNGAFTLFGRVQGNGELQLDDLVISPTSLFSNSGVLSAGVPGFTINPPARTLTINALFGGARIDLDGNGSGQVFVQQNATLDIDVPLLEAFSGTMGLGPNSTLDVEDAWELDGEINVNSSSFVLTAPATISGAPLTLESGATISLDESDEELHIAAQLNANNGSAIANNGTVVFNASAQFSTMSDFQLVGTHGSMVVNSVVEILQDEFDIDGSGQITNQVIVNANGQLTLDIGDFGGGINDLKADGVITINGGEMIVDPFGNWIMDGTLNMNGTATDTATLRFKSADITSQVVSIGDGVGTSDANVVVDGDGESVISYRGIRFNNDADVDIAADAVLDLNGITTYLGDQATFDGDGTLRPGLMNVTADTTFNVDIVDLEDEVTPDGVSSHTIDARLTINADAIDDDGDGFDGNITLHNDGFLLGGASGQLNVEVSSGSWRFDSGTITATNSTNFGGAFAFTGSDIQLGVEGGMVAINGSIASSARLDIFGSVEIATTNDFFSLYGGDSATPNRIEGGTVNGNGQLSLRNTELHGFGAISTNLGIVAGSTESVAVMADDGILTITGDIIELDVLGVTDDGTLFFPNPWSTGPVNDGVVLEGGAILGATITNNAQDGIHGHGEVNAAIDNDTVIRAEGGGTLIVGPGVAISNYDGAGGAGELHAATANLVLRNEAEIETFVSNIDISAGQEIFVEDFRMDLGSQSQLTINEGTYRVNSGVSVAGNVSINGSAPSRFVSEGASFNLLSSSSIDLDANLELEGNLFGIGSDTTFTGLANLVVLEGTTLGLQDEADVDVTLINHGVLLNGTLAVPTPASADLSGFTQTSTGEWRVDLGGLASDLHDALTIENNAVLDGTIDVNLLAGFTPLLGNSFTILETTLGNVGGVFDVENMPEFNGLTLDVIYNLDSVVLTVIEIPPLPGDYNDDGIVDAADYALWRNNLGAPEGTLPNDIDGGTIGQAQYDTWRSNFGATSASLQAGSSSTPEPTSAILALACFGCATLTIRWLHRSNATS